MLTRIGRVAAALHTPPRCGAGVWHRRSVRRPLSLPARSPPHTPHASNCIGARGDGWRGHRPVRERGGGACRHRTHARVGRHTRAKGLRCAHLLRSVSSLGAHVLDACRGAGRWFGKRALTALLITRVNGEGGDRSLECVPPHLGGSRVQPRSSLSCVRGHGWAV